MALSAPRSTSARSAGDTIVRVFAAIGILAIVAVIWFALRLPLIIDGWLDVTEPPQKADAIVCIAGGTDLPNLPTAVGWHRIYSTVQLYADGFAPLVVFTGRGSMSLSEAETYAEMAAWLGVPPEATAIDPRPENTADHPLTLLGTAGITHSSRLLLVTSGLHSRRVLMAFRKQGYANVRVVSEYRTKTAGRFARDAKTSVVPGFAPSTKSYDTVFSRGARSLERAARVPAGSGRDRVVLVEGVGLIEHGEIGPRGPGAFSRMMGCRDCGPSV